MTEEEAANVKYAIYKPNELVVKVLGTEEGLYHIEFITGVCLLCDIDELEWVAN